MINTLPKSLIEAAKLILEGAVKPRWAVEENAHMDKSHYKNKHIFWVDANELLPKVDPNFRVTPDSKENHIGNRMQRAIAHFQSGQFMDAPYISYDPNNKRFPVMFGDGRHRTAAAISMGHSIIPVKVDPEDVKGLSQHITLRPSGVPAADISHHHPKKHLNESMLTHWLNDKVDYDHQVSDLTLGKHITHLHGPTYEMPDPHAALAEEHCANLDPYHHHSVMAYITGGLEDGHDTGSAYVNEHLLKSHKSKRTPKKVFKFGDDEFGPELHLDHLDEALERNTLDKKLVTYSGVGFNPKELAGENGKIFLPAYVSSSTSKAVALMYAKPDKNQVHHMIQITHPKGSTGLYIGDNEDLSSFRQKEHIMPRNSMIKIHPEPEVHTDNMGNELHVWKATRIKA